METSGQLRDDLEQLCRTAKDTQLVRVRVKPYLAQASWKMWKALFRCKQYNLEAVCHIDGTLINGVFWRVLAAGLVLCIPLLLWYVLQQLRSALQVVRRPETFKRPLRAPYRHQISDAS
eukprot:g24964.t1